MAGERITRSPHSVSISLENRYGAPAIETRYINETRDRREEREFYLREKRRGSARRIAMMEAIA